MKESFDPEGRRLPIKLDSTSNGEQYPRPVGKPASDANALALETATRHARKLGLSRRAFLKSLPGCATTLLAMNHAFAQHGLTGGMYELPAEAAFETAAAESVLSGNEFIFDIQSHHVNPRGKWRSMMNQWNYILRFFPQSMCGSDAIDCFSAEHFIREIFLDSDTQMAVLSAVPAAPDDNPLSTEEAAATRAMVEAMQGNHRLLIHGLVLPNFDGALQAMQQQKELYDVSAWKTYTQWGPERKGYWLDDEQYGIQLIERARELEVRNICVHKGIPLPTLKPDYYSCRDVGVVARLYPDVNFIVYHSGYVPGHTEGPYDADNPVGVDTLIKTIQDNQIQPNSNVFAELGSTWRSVMQDSSQAAHLIGKLLKYVGEDNVLWGTDSIWYGSPQDQIQAFRSFQISKEFQEKFGYPEITPSIRAKVFGLNAAKPYKVSTDEIKNVTASDHVARIKRDYLQDPEPSFATNGPKTRREFLALQRLSGGRP